MWIKDTQKKTNLHIFLNLLKNKNQFLPTPRGRRGNELVLRHLGFVCVSSVWSAGEGETDSADMMKSKH